MKVAHFLRNENGWNNEDREDNQSEQFFVLFRLSETQSSDGKLSEEKQQV